jgi:photosystem II stability/assembly factor-like uncharacterized protein
MIRSLRILVLSALVFGVAFAGSVVSGQGQAAQSADPLDSLHFRSIGPATMSGRISDVAVYEKNPSIYYVATAHSGVWKTMNNGTTFDAQFQDQGNMSIGDVTISQTNPNLVWIGTGESANRQSVSWGNGVWKSTDGGQTWANMGLGESYHINRILIHPDNNDVVFVSAVGAVFGPGGDRGVYKTTDGGKSWRKVLSGDADTGADDLVMAPTNPNLLWATMYQRRRSQCCFNGGGPGSGLHKSTDGGETWTKVENGLPTGDLGRMAVDVYRRSANIMYVLVEAPTGAGGGGRGAAGGGARGGGAAAPQPAAPTGAFPSATGLYRSDDGGASFRQVSMTNPRPMYFSQLNIDPDNPDRVYYGGVGLQMTIDGGRSVATDAAQATHDDVHAIWINPANPDHILIGHDGGISVSYDMSRTWQQLNNLPLALYYHVSVDDSLPFRVCGGLQDNYNWCGPSKTRFSRGILNSDWYQVQGGDGFVVLIDKNDPRYVYSESQNGNIQRKNALTGEATNIRPSFETVRPGPGEGALPYRWNWDTPMIFSPHDPTALIVAANRVFRSNDRGDSWAVISPDLTTNADRSEIEIMGKRGNEIRIAANDGITSWPTIVSLAESPNTPGVYYTGTDDGVVQTSRDGGKTWTNITKNIPGFPAGAWVSEVVPSKFDAGTVYVTVDAHRLNDYKPYLWVSNDFGATFRATTTGLEGQVVRTLIEDTRNADVLYAGTETGLFVSFDRSKSWRRLRANLPTVRIDEMVIHPRDNSLVVGTHGRSIWILDNLAPVQEYTAAQAAASAATLFSVSPTLQWRMMDNQNDEFWGHNNFIGENPTADAVIQFHLKKPVGSLALRVTDAAGATVRTIDVPANRNVAGIQAVCWDMRVDPVPAVGGAAGPAPGRGGGGARGGGGGQSAVPGVPQAVPEPGTGAWNPCGGGGAGFGGGGANQGPWVLPGSYNVSLIVDGQSVGTKPVSLLLDPANPLTDVQRRRYFDIAMDLHRLQTRGVAVANALTPLHTQMTDLATKLPGMTNVPDAVKTQFAAVQKEFDTVREKFGVPPTLGAGGGRGGFGGGGGAAGAPSPNLLARAGTVKGRIMSFYDMPSDALIAQYTDVRVALPRAVTEANAVLVKATALSQALAKSGVTLTVPPAVR